METIMKVPWGKIEKTKTCWNWIGTIHASGYGEHYVKNKRFRAHRYVYETLRKKIETGLEIDHLCRNTLCVNPNHLEPVTHLENMRRALPFRKKITHCAKGHEFDEENTIYLVRRNKVNQRVCGKCKANVMERYFESHPRGKENKEMICKHCGKTRRMIEENKLSCGTLPRHRFTTYGKKELLKYPHLQGR